MTATTPHPFDLLAGLLRHERPEGSVLVYLGGVPSLAHRSTFLKADTALKGSKAAVRVRPDGSAEIGCNLDHGELQQTLAFLESVLLSGSRKGEYCPLVASWADEANRDNAPVYDRALNRRFSVPGFVVHGVCYDIQDGEIYVNIGKRSDNGLWENIIAGGIQAAQTPLEALGTEGIKESHVCLKELERTIGEKPAYLGLLHTLNQHWQRKDKIIQNHIHVFGLKIPRNDAREPTAEFSEFKRVPLRLLLDKLEGKKPNGQEILPEIEFKFDFAASLLFFAHHLKRLEPGHAKGLPKVPLARFAEKLTAPLKLTAHHKVVYQQPRVHPQQATVSSLARH